MKIAILDDYAGVALNMADWSGLGEITVFRDTLSDPEALTTRLRLFDVLCVMRERTPLPSGLLERLPNLKLIVTTGQRNASIDLEAARGGGITVCGTESRKTTTAELTLALMLALSRRVIDESAGLAAGKWQTGLGRDLYGQRLGLIGLGKIGEQVALLGKAFGMEVDAWSQNLSEARCGEVGVRFCATLDELMGKADVVSIHLVLSERTKGLIGPEALAAMKPGVLLINTSRGPIVDTEALLKGLREGRPGTAGLDVFDEEPLPGDHPLRDPELLADGRLLLTPHLGYVTEATWRLFYDQTVQAIKAWKDGSPIRVLNP